MIDIAKLVIGLILAAAFGYVIFTGHKAKEAGDTGTLRASRKAYVYLLVAGIPFALFVHALGGFGTWVGIILAILLGATTVLCLNILPTKLDPVSDVLWKDGPKTPGYSRSGHPVPLVRWARRIFMGLFLLFVLCAAFFGGPSTPAGATAQGNDTSVAADPTPTTPVTTTPAAPSTTDAPQASTPATVPTAKGDAVANPCGGPQLYKLTAAQKAERKANNKDPMPLGAGNLQVCKGGQWTNLTADTSGTLLALGYSADKSVAYMQVETAGGTIVIRTIDF